MNKLKIRDSIRILLLNQNQELLLMYAEDQTTTRMDGKYNGNFWFTLGGEIEAEENIAQAAVRELYEETGIKHDEVILGPVVWFGEFKLVVSGEPSLLKQRFIVAHTKNNNITLNNLTATEKKVIKKCEWFSLEQITNCKEIIYPICLKNYLPDIISGNYPEQPIELDLGANP